MELWLDAGYVRAGYSWSFPAGDELRVGVGSFWPSHHVKEPTVRLADDLGLPARGYQGNWIPHQLRRAVEDGVFFVGDSAGHCLPLTAEGIRTALYFGLACGRELRAVLDGSRTREQALARYAAFSDAHARKFRWLLAVQRAMGQITPSRAASARREGLREPAPEPLGVLPLPCDRAPVVRGSPGPPPGPRAPARAGAPPPRWPARPGWRSRATSPASCAAAASGSRNRAGTPPPSGDPRLPHQGDTVHRRGQAHDRVQPGRHAGHVRARQVTGDRRHERVPPCSIAAARLAQMAVVVAGFDQLGQGELLERRRAGVGQALVLGEGVHQPLGQHQPAQPKSRAPASC